jgi:hypothetical protein
VRPRSDEVCVSITFKAFKSVDARFALNSCRSVIENVTTKSRQMVKSSPSDLGCRISAFTILSYTLASPFDKKSPKNAPLFPWHILLPDVYLKPGLLCLFLRKCHNYLDEERDEWRICSVDRQKNSLDHVCSLRFRCPSKRYPLSQSRVAPFQDPRHLAVTQTWCS